MKREGSGGLLQLNVLMAAFQFTPELDKPRSSKNRSDSNCS